jgi:hypothetical protein
MLRPTATHQPQAPAHHTPAPPSPPCLLRAPQQPENTKRLATAALYSGVAAFSLTLTFKVLEGIDR